MKRVILVLIVTVIGSLASFFDAYWGLLLYNWYAFASPLELTYGVLLGTRLSLVVGGLLVFTTLYQHNKISLSHPLTFFMYAFLAVTFFSLSAQMSFDLSTIFTNLELLAKLVVISALTPVLLSNLFRIRLYILVIAISGGLLGFYYGVFGLFAGSKQILGPGRIGDNNGYAVFIASLIPFVFYAFKNIPFKPLHPFRGMVASVLVFGNLLALILTYSRGGFLAGSFVLLLLLLKIRSAIGRAVGWGMLLPVLLFSAWTIFSVDPNLIEIPQSYDNQSRAHQIISGYVTRLQTLRTELEDESSAGGRLHFWKVALVMVKENPAFGIGLGQYTHQYHKYDFSEGEFGSIRAVHNTPLLIMSETGLLGFIVFFGMIICMWIVLWKSKLRLKSIKDEPQVVELTEYISMTRISLCGFLFGGLFVNVPFQEIFWALMSISIAIDRCSGLLVEEFPGESELNTTPS